MRSLPETQKHLNADVFVNGQLHLELENAFLLFQSTVRFLLRSLRQKEQSVEWQIWPARQCVSGSTTVEDLDVYSQLVGSGQGAGMLKW